jgi:signal recognition particle subunit SRP54
MTMLDGDTRGGAALSIKQVTGKPIKFAGVGEKTADFEEFRPEGMANRILGMGDVVGLVQKAQQAVDQKQQEEFAKKIKEASLTLEDFLKQLQQVKKMGPLKDLLEMVPGLGKQLKGIDLDEKEFTKIEAIIQSMTPHERAHPDVIEHSRRQRIAKGSACEPADVNSLIKQFNQMKKMLKHMPTGHGKPKFKFP